MDDALYWGALYKGRNGWQVETSFPLPGDRELIFNTGKRHDGTLCTTAKVVKRDGLFHTFVVFHTKTLRREAVRCTAKIVQAQHRVALEDKDTVMAEVMALYYQEREPNAHTAL